MKEVRRGKKSPADPDPLGTTSGSLSDTTLRWPLKCFSGSNLNPGRQAQYPDQEKPVLLHSSTVSFTLGLNEDGRRATEEKINRDLTLAALKCLGKTHFL